MEITMEMVKQLREETHAGIMDCKKALAESNGDFAEAAKYLKKVGLAAVEKRADRATDEGRITYEIGKDKAVMVNVTCETDFVAKNDQFAKLGKDLCNLALAKGYKEVSEDMSELVKGLIATIHENMGIKKMVSLDIPSNGYAVGYNHANGAIGVLAVFTAKDKCVFEKEEFKTLAFNTAMHICAADPLYICDEAVPETYKNEQLEIFRAQVAQDAKLASKPEQVREGIVKGKLNKHLAEICLLDQVCQVYNDDGLTMAQIIEAFNKANSSDIAIKEFVRFRAGA